MSTHSVIYLHLDLHKLVIFTVNLQYWTQCNGVGWDVCVGQLEQALEKPTYRVLQLVQITESAVSAKQEGEDEEEGKLLAPKRKKFKGKFWEKNCKIALYVCIHTKLREIHLIYEEYIQLDTYNYGFLSRTSPHL